MSVMEALSSPRHSAALIRGEQPTGWWAASICSMKALSLPQNGTPPTAKEQPASRWTVSICSMEGGTHV